MNKEHLSIFFSHQIQRYVRLTMGVLLEASQKMKIFSHLKSYGPTKWFLTAKKQPKMMVFLTEASTNPTISTKVSMVLSNWIITPI